jgi:organic radical activating enzyme
LFYNILDSGLDGITISGGEPFDQSEFLLHLLQLLNSSIEKFPNGIIVFTGYTTSEIRANSIMSACMELIDLTIAGPYIESQKQCSSLAGSSNQEFVFLEKPGRGREKIPDTSSGGIEVTCSNSSPPYMIVTGFPDFSEEVLKHFGIELIE